MPILKLSSFDMGLLTQQSPVNRRAATLAGQFFYAFALRSRSLMKMAGFRLLRVEPYSLLHSRIA